VAVSLFPVIERQQNRSTIAVIADANLLKLTLFARRSTLDLRCQAQVAELIPNGDRESHVWHGEVPHCLIERWL
ncbi:MAG TPA: hypothetical protein VML55_16360, partial [Planctomycetaceae bacterium]|nr:hypothetical protein [Planctomycetaceae bacterium]